MKPAERMISKLLERDAEFFTDFHYDIEVQELDTPRFNVNDIL